MKNVRCPTPGAILFVIGLFITLPASSAHAACNTTYLDKAYLNEYYFGTDPNYLEVFIPNNNKVLPADWDSWKVRVYTGSGTSDFTDYPLSTSNPNVTACDFGSKTYITYDVSGGLPGTGTAVNAVLLDGSGNEVDYLKFDNKFPITEYVSPQCNYPANHDTDLLIANYGNKDLARFPDGKGDWSVSSLTGANTTYTQCTSNDASIAKTVSAATIPVSTAPNPANYFTITVTNPGNKDISLVTVTDAWPAGLSYDNYSASTGTFLFVPLLNLGTWTIGTLPKNSSATLTLYFHGTTVGSYTNTANLTYLGITYPAADSAIANIVPALDHIRLLHTGSGLTCAPSAVTVQACTNADCSSLYTDSLSVTLSPTGWEGGDTVTLTNGTGTFNLWHTTAGTVTLGAASSPGAANATRCFIGATESCSHTFATSGFTFAVPTQTSGKPSSPVTISAVKADPTDPQSCAPAFSGPRTVNFWSSYLSPSPYSGTPALQVNGTAVSGSSPGTPLSLTFDSNAQSTFTVQYPDAGMLQLDARYASSSGNDAGLVMSGASQFVVKPAGYCVTSPDANADCASGDATCSAFVAAGAPFNLTVTAKAWESDTDTDLCSGNATTPNFQLNGIPLAQTLVSPVGGASGTLGATSVNITSNGTATLSNESISEVGVFTISADASNYLGVTTNPGTSANIGRFYPAAFGLNITDHGSFAAGCSGCTTPFTYLGDSFGYDTTALPTLTFSALNTNGDTTLNYRGDFAKLATNPAATIALTYPTTDSTTNNAAGSAKLGVTSSVGVPSIAANGDGTVTLKLGGNTMDRFTYDKELVKPFAADLDIVLNSLFDGDITTTYTSNNVITPVSAYEQRYGRITLSDTYGSSSAGTTIAIPLTIQYYDSTESFVANSDDTVTSISSTYLVCTDPAADTLNCLIPTAATVGNGGSYTLTADGNSGTLYYDLDLSAATGANLEFLRFDWDSDTTPDDPQATVVLGSYPYYHNEGRFRIWFEGN